MLLLNNITKSFSGVFAPVLKGINLSIEDGEFCVVLGANGSGKSTLFKVISGEYKPDVGDISCNHLISQVTQDVNKGTIPELTLLENLALSQIRLKRPKMAFYERYRSEIILKIKTLGVGLEESIKQQLKGLSGGQRQVIATLMALYSGGKILLLDEHTSALDPKMQDMLMKFTAKSVAELGITTMMITHKLDDAVKYGNRVIMLHKGKIVFDVKGAEKAKLTIKELLALFHKYEDQILSEDSV